MRRLCLFLVLLLGPPTLAQPSADARAAIAQVNEQFMDAWARGDAQAIAALYTSDGQLLPNGQEPVEGRAALAQFFAGGFSAGLGRIRLETLELEAHGDTAYEIGRYTLTAADGEEAGRGKYVVIWKREDDAWRLHRDIMNGSPSAP